MRLFIVKYTVLIMVCNERFSCYTTPMEWVKLVFLLSIVLIGYLPYKTIQRNRKGGLANISTQLAIGISFCFVILSTFLILQTPNLIINRSLFPVFFLGITVLIWVLAPWLLHRMGTLPAKVIEENPTSFLIRTQPKMFLLKFCEVLFQQAKFAYLLFVVLDGLPFVSRVVWFSVIVSLLHLYNVNFVRAPRLFFFISIPMGPLFSLLILNGYIFIAITIHLWFYLLLVSRHWFRLESYSHGNPFFK